MTTLRPRPSGATQFRPRPSGATTNPSHLLSGHATDTLSPAERNQLYRAALDDQKIFDQLVEEESWRQIFSSPGVRQELMEALAVAPDGRVGIFEGLRGWLDGFRIRPRGGRRYMPTMAMGAVAAALLALVMVPRWLELGVTGPVEGPPRVAAPSVVMPPATGEAPGEASTKYVAKSYGSSPETSTGEAARPKFVAKSYGGSPEGTAAPQLTPKGTTRGLSPKSTGSDYLNLSYTLELNQRDGPRQVPETHAFRPGDQFRLRLGVDFTAWLYLFNRASGDDVYSVLYPHTAAERDPLPPSQREVLLPADFWLTMDDSPEDEQLVLVVSALPWPPAGAGRETIPVSELNAALTRAESGFESLSWRRSEVEDRVRLTVEEGEGAMVVVLRLLG